MKIIFKWIILVLVVLLIVGGYFIWRKAYKPIVKTPETATFEELSESFNNIGDMAAFRFELWKILYGSNKARQMTVEWLKKQNIVEDAGTGEDGTSIWFKVKRGLRGVLPTHQW